MPSLVRVLSSSGCRWVVEGVQVGADGCGGDVGVFGVVGANGSEQIQCSLPMVAGLAGVE